MTEKECSSCKEVKPTTEFHRRKDKYQPYCKACKKAQDKEYYKSHTPEMKTQISKRKVEVVASNRVQLFEYLQANPCVHCGNSNPVVLEFHHRDPEQKSRDVSVLAGWNVKWETIMLEIEKCDVLCANCHRIETSKQQGWWKS